MEIELAIIEKIRQRKARLAILGMGHVGLPTALIFASVGFHVSGIDVDNSKVETLRRGSAYIAEPGLEEILRTCLENGTFKPTTHATEAIHTSDIVTICVPTPVENSIPNLTQFEDALKTISQNAHENLVVLIESTLPPSTTFTFAVPRLESLGYKIDESIFLAYCPERITPTQALKEFGSNTRIIGGTGPKSCRIAEAFYKTVCDDVRVADALTAEITKVAENTFRDLNIAFANLIALISERFGADAAEVISLANTHPRVSIHRPGIGVGGPCLPKDPYILIHGTPADLTQLVTNGRKLNEFMPRHAVDTLMQTATARSVKGRKVAILGVTYKADSEDATNSPAKFVIQELLDCGASVSVYDPHTSTTFGGKRALSLEEAVADADFIMVLTDHKEFKAIDSCLEKGTPKYGCVLFDGPRILNPARVKSSGMTYLGTGYGRDAHSRGWVVQSTFCSTKREQGDTSE